jgi:hypothetical protein
VDSTSIKLNTTLLQTNEHYLLKHTQMMHKLNEVAATVCILWTKEKWKWRQRRCISFTKISCCQKMSCPPTKLRLRRKTINNSEQAKICYIINNANRCVIYSFHTWHYILHKFNKISVQKCKKVVKTEANIILTRCNLSAEFGNHALHVRAGKNSRNKISRKIFHKVLQHI